MKSIGKQFCGFVAIAASFSLVVGACNTETSPESSRDASAGARDSGGDDTAYQRGSAQTTATGGSPNGTKSTVLGSLHCVIGGNITTAKTIAPDPTCPSGYEVDSTIHVSGIDGVLTIAPGTVLKFDAGTGLSVEGTGTIKAVGTQDAPIVFTGWQKTPGSWTSIVVSSQSMKNEIAHAIVEYAGESRSDYLGAVSLGDGVVASVLSLSAVEMRKNGYFGLSLAPYVKLPKFENCVVADNVMGAMRARPGSVHLFKGVGNRLENNGGNNSVRIAAGSVDADVTWPNLAPSVYRAVDESGNGEQISVSKHLTIEPGTVIEFASGMGMEVQDSAAGLSAIGTADAPIVFRGIDTNAWLGIGFAETSWTGNALENVQFENAYGAPPNYHWTSVGISPPGKMSVALGQLVGPAAYLRVKNVSFAGPNAASSDISVTGPATLVVEGTNRGAGTGGVLSILDVYM